MYRYAQIDESGKCVSVSQLAGEIDAAYMLPLALEDDVLPGDIYDGETWTRPEPPAPEPDRISQLETEIVETMLGLAEVYETTTDALAVREQETVDTMLGLAEAYEIILMQQTTIDALSARVAALEGGES